VPVGTGRVTLGLVQLVRHYACSRRAWCNHSVRCNGAEASLAVAAAAMGAVATTGAGGAVHPSRADLASLELNCIHPSHTRLSPEAHGAGDPCSYFTPELTVMYAHTQVCERDKRAHK